MFNCIFFFRLQLESEILTCQLLMIQYYRVLILYLPDASGLQQQEHDDIIRGIEWRRQGQRVSRLVHRQQVSLRSGFVYTHGQTVGLRASVL